MHGLIRALIDISDVIARYLLLHLLLHGDRLLLVFAPLVLKPHPDHAWTQPRHFDELFLHQGIRPRIRRVASSQSVQLLFVENCTYPRRLSVGTAATFVATGTANATDARLMRSALRSGICKHKRREFSLVVAVEPS